MAKDGAPDEDVQKNHVATTHVVGAGLAGLAAAVRLARAGRPVRLYEATDHAGGRCRSFYDPRLDRVIDNGNHLVLTGNRSVRAYVDEIGAAGMLRAAETATLPFVDIASGERWRIAMNAGPIPWWVAAPSRRAAGTRMSDYTAGIGLAFAGSETTVADAIKVRGPAWERFWEPMTLAALNTPPERGAAKLLWAVIRETFAKGASASRPMFAPKGLGEALVAPALSTLATHGVEPRYGAVLKAIEVAGEGVAALVFADGRIPLKPGDQVILALPPSRLRAVLGDALPHIDPPEDRSAIVNAHFVPEDPRLLDDAPPIIGVLSSKTHWVFVRDGVASVTISAADALGLAEAPSDELLPTLWDETRKALGLPGDATLAAGRILREKRATFDQSPAGVKRRPKQTTGLSNLTLAGDATDTGLPATIEGAVRSGHNAAAITERSFAATAA